MPSVYAKTPIFDGRTCWMMCLWQSEAAVCANDWTEKEKAVSLFLALEGLAAELLQKVPPDCQNTYTELIKL